MPGGLLQLVAYGIQDFILTGDPQITFFKKAYRRNTLFSSEILKLKFSGDQEFDKTSVCKIPNNGDLLGKSVLQIDLPIISCYQIKEDSNTINVDNTYQENQILKKLELLNEFLDKKLDQKQSQLLTYIKVGSSIDDIKKNIYDIDNYMVKYNLNFTSDEIEYLIDNDTWSNLSESSKSYIKDLLEDTKKLEVKDVGNLLNQKKYYNSLLNNFYFSLIKLSIFNQLEMEYFRFLDNKLQTFYNKHILNSYDISNQINNRLKEKILISWYKNKIQEINSSSAAQDLDENEYNLNFLKDGVETNNINDYNTIINDNIIPSKFTTDIELSYSYGKEIYQKTINQSSKISSLLFDSLKINFLVIKSLINILYNPDAKLILYLKYTYNTSNSDRVGAQSLIFSDDVNWLKYYNKLFNLYDENNNKILITDYNLPIKNLLEKKFTQFRSEMDSIMKSLTVINSDNSNDFFKFLSFINSFIGSSNGSARFNDSIWNSYNFSTSNSSADTIYFNTSTISTYVDTYSNNLIFIDFNSFIYLQIKNKTRDSFNYINTNILSTVTGEKYVENIHDQIYNYLEYQIRSSDVTDLSAIKSSSNDVFTFLCSVVDFNKLFTVETIVDNYVKNIASYKYTLNIDPNLIGQNINSKHILKIVKKYTIDSSWYSIAYQNNNTTIIINNLFTNRSFYKDIFASYTLQINDVEYKIKNFNGNYPYEGTDLLELTIDDTISDIQTVVLVSEKSNIITFNSNTNSYYSTLYLNSNKLVIERINDILIKDPLITDIDIEVSLDSNILTSELIEKSSGIVYSRDIISQYLNLSYDQTYVNLFDEKIYPLLQNKILDISKSYKYYQLVSINQNVLDTYKKFFDEFISELSETVGSASYNYYDLISKKNEKLSMERINRELNNTTDLVSTGNINGNSNPTNIIVRNTKNITNPPLYQYELVEDDTIIVTNNTITYNYNVTSISANEIILDQKFNFDKNDVTITKETKYINYGGGYKISSDNNQYLITGLVPVIDYPTNPGIITSSNKDELNVAITYWEETKNSIIQVVPNGKITSIQIIGISTRALTVSADPSTDFTVNQKIFTKSNQLVGVVNTIINSNGIYIINLKKDINLPIGSLNINDYLYQSITIIRKVVPTNTTNSKLIVEEQFFNTSTNIKQITNIIPSETSTGQPNLYLDSVFRNVIGVSLNITNNSNFLTGISKTNPAVITNQEVIPKTAIPDYSYTLASNDRIAIYDTKGFVKYDIIKNGATDVKPNITYSIGTKNITFTIAINTVIPINSKIFKSDGTLLGIVRSIDANNSNTIILDENGLYEVINTNTTIYKEVSINELYDVNLNNTNIELKNISDGTNVDTSQWPNNLESNTGKIYKISNKNRLVKSIDNITSYKIKALVEYNFSSTTTIKTYIDGRKPIDTKIKATTIINVDDEDITLDLTESGADINNITINSNLYKSDGSFIGKVLTKDTTSNQISLKDGSKVSLSINEYLHVLNDISKSSFICKTAITSTTTSSTDITIDKDGVSLINYYIYKKDNSLIGQVTDSSNSNNLYTITFAQGINSTIAQDEELYITNVKKTSFSVSSVSDTTITINANGASLINKKIYKDGNLLIGTVQSFSSVEPFTITINTLQTTPSADDIIWMGEDVELFNYNLTANIPIYLKDSNNNYNKIGTVTSSGNFQNEIVIDTISSSSILINPDDEIYFETNLLRINAFENHLLNNKDDILIYNNSYDKTSLINNDKYKIYSAVNNSFNLIDTTISDTGNITTSGSSTIIYNVYGSEIGDCYVSSNKLIFTSTKIYLDYSTELYVMNSSSKLESLKLIVLDDYPIGTTQVTIGQIINYVTPLSNAIDLTKIKDGKIQKIDSVNSLEKQAILTKTTDNLIQFASSNHSLIIGDMIIIYNVSDILYPNKIKAIISKIVDNNTFIANIDSTNITPSSNTIISANFYKIPFVEYNLKSIVTTTNSNSITTSQLEFYCNHDLLDGDKILIYNSDQNELNNSWIVKKVNQTKIQLIYSEDYNYNFNKYMSSSYIEGAITGIIIKVETSSITGVNFNKYIKYSDIIKIDNSDYNDSDTYLEKFPKVQYRSIKKIQDTIIELDEAILIPYKKENIDLVKYEIPNFTNDLKVNSIVRVKIGNVYESKQIKTIIDDNTLEVDSNFSSDINYYVDLNQVVYQDTNIQSQIFNLDFKKIFSFNSKTFNGIEYFEKNTSNIEITYNNWEKFRYYIVSSDITNNPNNYDIYIYSNKLNELNNLHWNYYLENYKILKIKAFTPNVINYTKSIPELILYINKIIYDYKDMYYTSDLQLDIVSSKNYNTLYYIDDKTNKVELEKKNNLLKLQTTKNLNEYNQHLVNWNKKHELQFTDFINQKFKLTDSYVKRLNKMNRITNSEISMDEYSGNNYQFNIIEGLSKGIKSLDNVERLNESKYYIKSDPITIESNYNLHSDKIIDNTINKNLFLSGTNKIVLKNNNMIVIDHILNSYNKKLLDKIYLQEEINIDEKNYNLSYVRDYDLIITRVDNQMLYFSNFSNDLDINHVVKSGEYIRFKLDDDQYIRQVSRVVNGTQIELSESLYINKYFVDETPVKVNKVDGYDINTSINIIIDTSDPNYYFNSNDNIFDSDGNLIGVIASINNNSSSGTAITTIVLSANNLVKVEDDLNLYSITNKVSKIEVFNYHKIDQIEKKMFDLSGLVSFNNTTVTGIGSKFQSEINLGDKLLFRGYDIEIELLKIERLAESQYQVNLEKELEIEIELDLNKSYILEEKNGAVNKVNSIQKIGISSYYLFLNSDIIIDSSKKYSIFYSDKNYEERLVTTITSDTQLSLDKASKISHFLDKTIFELKKHDSAKFKNIGTNLTISGSSSNTYDHFVTTINPKDTLSIGNLLKIVVNVQSKDQTYFRRIKSIDFVNNKVYLNQEITTIASIANSQSIDLMEYYAYKTILNNDYPEENYQILECKIDVAINTFDIKSSGTSLFKNKLVIGDKLVLKNESKQYDLNIVNLYSDTSSNPNQEVITVDKKIDEAIISKENILYKVNDIKLETPYNYQINKESKSLLLTGLVTISNINRKEITGTHTLFKSEVKIGDYVMINFNQNYDYGIVSKIISDTEIEIDHDLLFFGNNLQISKYLILPPSELTGRVNINNTNLIEGIDTKFVNELQIGDKIIVDIDNNKLIRKINYIYNENLIEIDSAIIGLQTNLVIHKINKLCGYQLDLNDNTISDYKLGIKVVSINSTTLTLDKDATKVLNYGDNIVNQHGLLIGMITEVNTDKTIKFDQFVNTINVNDDLYLPNMIKITNSSLRIGSTLKFNDNKITTISKNLQVYEKIETGLYVNSSNTNNNITTITFKFVNVNKFVKKGSLLLNANNQIIGVVNSVTVNQSNNNVQTKLESGITLSTNDEIFVANSINYLILNKPLLEISSFTVDTPTYTNDILSSLTVYNTDSNIIINTKLYNNDGLFLGSVNNISINLEVTTLTITNGSKQIITANDNLYYQMNYKLIKSVEEIQNCMIESDVTIISNSNEITFEKPYKPNMDVDDKLLINNSIICKINSISKNKIILNNQINLASNSYSVKKLEKSLISIIQEKDQNEFKYFDIDYVDLSKKTYTGNIIYQNTLDTSSTAKYYFNSVYPINNLYSGNTGFISSVESEYDVLPLDRTVRYENKETSSTISSITGFKYVQFELNDLHYLEEFYNYKKKASYISKLIESKSFNITNINFRNSSILNNWTKIIDVKIDTPDPEEIKLDLNSKFSLNQTDNIVNILSDIKLRYQISNIKVTTDQITVINGLILTVSGSNILNDYHIGTSIFNNNEYIGKVTQVTNNTITLDSVTNLSVDDYLEVSSFKSADNSNKIYSIRSDIFDYDFNPNYSYKISTFNQYNNLVNQYIITRIEKLKNISEIKFYSSSIISELQLKDSTKNYSSFVSDNIRFVFESINSYQLELSNQTADNKNNTLIQEKEYTIENINQDKTQINSEFTFKDTEIFNIINPSYDGYLTLDEIFELIAEEFINYYGHRQLYNIFNQFVNVKDLILLCNLTYLYNQTPAITNDQADYTQHENYNGIVLKKENVINTFDYLVGSATAFTINQDIHFITDKLNIILTNLICQEKFIEQEYLKQDLIINSQIQYIQNVYYSSITNKYVFELGTILKEEELSSIKEQKIIDKNTFIYKENQIIKNITILDKWVRIETERTINNLEGVWSILEKGSDGNYIYHNAKVIEKRDDLIFYLEMVNTFDIDTSKTYYLESSFSIEKIEKDWTTLTNFIITFNVKPNQNNQILALEEYNSTSDYQSNTINKVLYLDEIEEKENLKYYIKLEIDLNKLYRLTTTFKLSRRYLLPNQFEIDSSIKLKRRINFDQSISTSMNLEELFNISQRIDQNQYNNYQEEIDDIQKIIKFVNFDDIINYLRINKIDEQMNILINKYIKIPSERVASDFLFNLNKYHTQNLINYFYYYFSENYKGINYSEIFNVKNLIDYNASNRYLLDLTKYNIEFMSIESISFYGYLENSNFTTSDYTTQPLNITNYYQIYTNPYHTIIQLDTKIIDLERDPYTLSTNAKYYILVKLLDGTEVKVLKELSYIRDDNIKINYDITLNNYQLVTADSKITLDYKYLQNVKESDVEIITSNSINNLDCNLPDLVTEQDKINISHTYNQPVNSLKIVGYLYKFYFIKNTELNIYNTSILNFGSNPIKLLKETSDDNLKILEVISNAEFVYKEYFLLQENSYPVKSYNYQVINDTQYQNKLVINFREHIQDQDIDVNYTNYYIIKIDTYFRKIFDIINDKEIIIEEENALSLSNKASEKIKITYLEDLLLIKDFNKTSIETISQATINNTTTNNITTTTITGTNTIFQTQLSVDDIIIINNKYVRQVETISSDTSIILNESVPNITIVTLVKINYLSESTGIVSLTNNKKITSSTHNLGTYFYYPVTYLNKIPIKTIESSYIKIHGKINKANINGLIINGTNTKFTKDLKVGDKIRLKTKHNNFEYRNIVQINSDTQIQIDFGINNFILQETNIFKLQKLLGQIKISGDEYNVIDGTNTKFIKQLRVSDFIRIEINGFDYIRQIKSIESDIKLTIEGTFNQEVNTLTNYFYETNGYILDLNYNFNNLNLDKLEIIEEARLFFESFPISEDYFGLLELNFNQELNIDESHTQEFDFTLKSYNTKLVKSYPLVYNQIISPTSYLFLVKNINISSSLSWTLYYKNVLSGFQTYSIDYANLGNLNEYVYEVTVKIGLNFTDLNNGFNLSFSNTELTETNNTAQLYYQENKQILVLVKPTVESLPIPINYYLIVKNEFNFNQYQVDENKVNVVLSDKLIYYADVDSYKHKYYIVDTSNNLVVQITDIVDQKEQFNYQLTLPAKTDLTNSEYKIIHLRQLQIEKMETYKKDRTLDIEFNKDVHFNKKAYGESASQYLSGSNQIDFDSKIYKYDLLGDKIHDTATYNIIKSPTAVNEIGQSLYYFDAIVGTNYTDNTLNIGDSILFYSSNKEYNPRVREIENIDSTNRRVYIDKVNIEATSVIIYKYSELNMNLQNTNYSIKYGNSGNFDILNFYDGSGKRQLYFTTKTPLIRQTNILKIIDTSNSNKEYFRFIQIKETDGLIIEEAIGSDISSNATIYYQKSESINFMDQNYTLIVTNTTTVTMSETPNSELVVNDIVIIENKYIRKVTVINGNVITIDIAIPDGTYYNISKLYLVEELLGDNLTYTDSTRKITTTNTSFIDLDDKLIINSETDVTKNISLDPVDNYPIIRIDTNFDYLNPLNANIRLNDYGVSSILFINNNIDGNYIKLIIQNKDTFTITQNTIYKLYKTNTLIPKYKEFNGRFPLDLSFYKSTSFRKHTFLINSINKRKISDNFLISYQNNIVKVKNRITENIEIYNEKILRNKKLIKPATVSENNLELSFIKNIGYYIINYIQVFIGEQKIDRHTGEWLDLYHQLYTNNNKQFNKMIGDIPELIKYDKTPKGNYRLYVPLKFWFCQKPGLALPLIALHNNSIRIEMKLSKLEDCIKYASNGILKQEGNINVNLLAEYYYLEETERKLFAESKHEYLIERIQSIAPEMITEKFNNVKIDFVDPIKDIVWVIKSQKNIDNKENSVYCDTEEIINYDIYQNDYLDNLKIYNQYITLNTPIELIPNSFIDEYKIFSNLVDVTLDYYLREKYMKFYLQYEKETINADWSYTASTNIWTSSTNHNLILNDVIMFNTNGGGATNYLDNQVYFIIKVVSTTQIQLSRKYNGTEFKGNDDSTNVWKADKINNGRNAQNNGMNTYNFKVKKEQKEIKYHDFFDKGAIKIYNRKITSDKDAHFYNYVQTMNYKKTPDQGIYVHNFSLYPLEDQPSGSCNFSVTGDNRLEFEATERISKDNPGSLRLYGRSYNVLRIMSGFGGLAFYE